jgi:hypothetical protein
MELNPRQMAFIKSEMQKVKSDETRQPTARVEAERIREQADTALTE